DDLRRWSLWLTQVSDLSKSFPLTPPHYRGPSTGYDGPLPLVKGAGQLGVSLAVDGLPANTEILRAGDFLSFATSSAHGATNHQLFQAAADVTSDGAGEATIRVATPIRQSAADRTPVQIYAPVALFRLNQPRAGV